MIKNSLHQFADSVLAANAITAEDVRRLQMDILPDDLMHRAEADLLIALDRMVDHQCQEWGDVLVRLIVDFTVWGSRPTGRVDADTASWLTTSLSAGDGPTPNAVRAAFEAVREAQQVDEALVSFVLQGARAERGRRAMRHEVQRDIQRPSASAANAA